MTQEWIELNLPYWDIYSKPSFEGKELNKPGTLIETDLGIFLIGHINTVRGICDDCTEFSHDTIVRRYKIVWES